MDMRNTKSGNPTVTEDYDDSDAGNRVVWLDEERVRVYKHGTMLYTGKIDSGIRNLVEAAGLEIPENPYLLQTTEIHYYEVHKLTDEYRSQIIGRFWNEDEADAYAARSKGWYGSPNTVRERTLIIQGARS